MRRDLSGGIPMSLKKQYLKSRPVSKVTFRLPADAAPNAREVWLVGDFNEWQPSTTPMRRLKNGDYTVTLDLEPGREYQFRYLIDGERWENDWEADTYRRSGIADAENSVVVL
jgi:1,4-alpha-glucan branching enzyme